MSATQISNLARHLRDGRSVPTFGYRSSFASRMLEIGEDIVIGLALVLALPVAVLLVGLSIAAAVHGLLWVAGQF